MPVGYVEKIGQRTLNIVASFGNFCTFVARTFVNMGPTWFSCRHVLVVPRLIACLLLTPMLTVYSDFLGVVGGWVVSVKSLNVPAAPYWEFSAKSVDNWQIFEGLIKSLFFGGAIALIGCYKGFTCGSGASGVGRACTESFVSSFIA